MNIKEAKEQIRHAIQAYLTKNEFNEYRIPLHRQRPLFLLGPPGIGKTAIMEQISKELQIGLVAYSMTHHTRQSALGLPFIAKKEYGGKQYSVSEYTMSEIIASVYNSMELTGLREGILFLDEINCVSETLAPAMLQFLQYKVFGQHRVPDGWVVVTAGNPPDFNSSVREFDVVTLDRLKVMNVEPEQTVWKEYAYRQGVHNAVMTYLDIKKDEFYSVETTVEGLSIVTPRAWEDLSEMIVLYEDLKLPVNEALTVQYLQNKKIAKGFAIYYDLYMKYKSDYQVNNILNGVWDDTIMDRARNARFDERLSLLSLLLSAVNQSIRDALGYEEALSHLASALGAVRAEVMRSSCTLVEALQNQARIQQEQLQRGITSQTLTDERKATLHRVVAKLEEYAAMKSVQDAAQDAKPFSAVKKAFDADVKKHNKQIESVHSKLSNLFAFATAVFGEGHEVLVIVTELTMNYYAATFIGRYGCREYFEHNKQLLFYERQQEIIKRLSTLPMSLGDEGVS